MPTTTIAPARAANPSAVSSRRGADRATGETLAALYANHGGELRRFANNLTGDHGRAEDVVQETMLRAWYHPEAVGGHHATPRTWLYTVARHVAIDQNRARRARATETAGLPELTSCAAPDHIDAAITRWDLDTALAALHPRDRYLLTAHYLHDRSIAEIAAELQVPAGTVKSRLFAARDALRQSLQPAVTVSPPRNTSGPPPQASAAGRSAGRQRAQRRPPSPRAAAQPAAVLTGTPPSR
jgi:RNA polymerase sigma-70 factor, ECF subfamily